MLKGINLYQSIKNTVQLKLQFLLDTACKKSHVQ